MPSEPIVLGLPRIIITVDPHTRHATAAIEGSVPLDAVTAAKACLAVADTLLNSIKPAIQTGSPMMPSGNGGAQHVA